MKGVIVRSLRSFLLSELSMLNGRILNNAFMHVFVNTTSIKKYEKEKAINKCLHIMFSSISHEFRTPLNAFMNSTLLIEISFEAIMNAISSIKIPNKNILDTIEKYKLLFNRNLQTSKISSKTLLSLVEDILDFAKIEAGMFSLSERPFLIQELVNELLFIFEYQ